MNKKELNASVKICSEPSPVALTLLRGASYVIYLNLCNTNGNVYIPEEFNDVKSWSFSLDADFDHKKSQVIIADNSNITIGKNKFGNDVLIIPISITNTMRLAEVIGTSSKCYLYGQLLGLNSNAEVCFSLLMKRICIQNNLDGEAPTENKSEYAKKVEVKALISACEYGYQQSTQNIKGDFCVDFGGDHIRIYDAEEAISGTLIFSSLGFLDETQKEELGVNTVKTVETWIPASGDIETFVFPDYVELIDFPDNFPAIDGFPITYHVFLARYVQISVNGVREEHIQINYNYSFGAGLTEG